MSKYDYSRIYETAVRLINRFGAVFIHKQLDGSYTKRYNVITSSNEYVNAAGDVFSEQPYIESTHDGVVSNFSIEDRYDTSIKRGDKLLLAVLMDTPQSGDIFIIGGVAYSYINHETIQPASTFQPLLYKIQVRV